MEDPVREIPDIIAALTQCSPSKQRETLEAYFTSDASFTHPFCRTGRFGGSRLLIEYIYSWYKILSPRVELEIMSVAFDQPNLLLYVTLRQVFSVQFLPLHRAEANLTTILTLTRNHPTSKSNQPLSASEQRQQQQQQQQQEQLNDKQLLHCYESGHKPKYYICAQNDFYQTSEFVKFVLPWFNIGSLIVVGWQFFATLLCMVLSILFWPVTWVEENVWGGNRKGGLVEIVRRR